MLAESRLELELAGPVGFLALHAGLENGTGDVAVRAAARVGGSLLVVRQQSNDVRLHVSSNDFLPELCPPLGAVLDHCGVIVSLHGHYRPAFARGVLVGGRDRRLAAEMAGCLRRHTRVLDIIDDLAVIPSAIAGLNPTNPVNRAEAGVQLEIPHLPDPARPWSLAMDPHIEGQLLGGLCEFAATVAADRGGRVLGA
jgi:phage replication-related protein YjqB (UPF0714/DUF867 family)